jgi:hypothetical protein
MEGRVSWTTCERLSSCLTIRTDPWNASPSQFTSLVRFERCYDVAVQRNSRRPVFIQCYWSHVDTVCLWGVDIKIAQPTDWLTAVSTVLEKVTERSTGQDIRCTDRESNPRSRVPAFELRRAVRLHCAGGQRAAKQWPGEPTVRGRYLQPYRHGWALHCLFTLYDVIRTGC